jgi:beta-lactam-binding protein with PASTA domain
MDDFPSNTSTPGSTSSGPEGAGSEVAASGSPDAKVPGDVGLPPAGAPKKKTSPWVWVAIAAVVVLILGGVYAATSSSDSGGGLFLLFGGGQTVSVPLVVGETQAGAESIITAAGLRVGQISQVDTLGVAPGLVVSQSPTEATKVKEDSAVDISVSVVPQVEVPELVGKSESAASAALAEVGLRIGSVGYAYSTSVQAGSITAQSPQPKTQVVVGSAVDVTVSKGEQQGQVPNVVGLAQSDAQSTLEGAGFKVTTTKATSTAVPAGDVISQSPAAGTVVTAGSTVTIKVSTGPPDAPKATVPDVVGMGFADAFNALQNAGLNTNIEFAPSSDYVLKVAEQAPAAGTSVDPGTTVTVTIGLPSFSFEKPSVEPSTLPAPAPPAPGASSGSTSGVESTPSP